MQKYKSSKFSIPDIMKTSSAAAATISKLNTSKKSAYDISKVKTDDISNSIKQRIKNNEDIVELFPDVELSMQILTSSVLAPSNMIDVNLLYLPPALKMPSDIKASAINMIKEYITETYNIEDKLTTIFREAYFTKGSYSEIIVPESSVDDLIHGDIGRGEVSVESIADAMSTETTRIGAIGDLTTNLSTESIVEIGETTHTVTTELSTEELDVSVSENWGTLFAKKVFLDKADDYIQQTLYGNVATEGLDEIFMLNDDKEESFIHIKSGDETSRENLDKPLVMKIQPESIIPVHVKNDPSKHLGYFIVVDEQGTPVSGTAIPGTLENYMQDMVVNSKSAMIKKAKDALYGITKKDPKLENIAEIYNTIVDNMITKKLESGIYSGIAEVRENADVYRTMFMRSLESKKTKLLFLPKELVSYIAFDYRENGTGKSMLEKVAVLFSMRAVLLFSKMMANIKNSVSVTNVSATLDEDDNDPEQTKEIIISEAIKSRQAMLPLGATNVHDLVDWSHKVGYRFNINHPDLPNIEIDSSEEAASNVVPDDQLDEDIQEWIIMSFGLTADMVKAGYDPEFASTFLAKNLLLSKRVIGIQTLYNPKITDYVRKLLMNDPIIKGKLAVLFMGNIKPIKSAIKKTVTVDDDITKILKKEDALIEYIVNKYVSGITVKLPKPEVTEYTADKDAFSDRKDMIEDYIDVIFSSDALPSDLLGDIADDIDNIKVVFKTMLLKKWANENGYLPEVSDFLSFDEDGKPIINLLEEYSNYSEAIAKVVLPFIKKNKKTVDKLDEAKDKIENGDEDEEDNTDDTSASDDNSTDDTDGNVDTGGDDTVDENMDEDTDGTGDTDSADDTGDDASADDDVDIDNI